MTERQVVFSNSRFFHKKIWRFDSVRHFKLAADFVSDLICGRRMKRISADQQIIHEQLSETVQSFSKAFSCAVTETWPEDGSFLAKNGSDSVYSLFESMFPQVKTSKWC
jgi:hypothetical protein